MKRTRFLVAIGILLTAALWPLAAQDSGASSVSVDNQGVIDARVVIAKVVSSGPGWLVVHTQADGKPGPVIGYSAVRNGVNLNVVVAVDTKRVTEKLYAMLHADAGAVGVYEFPGPDAPVMVGGVMVNVPFAVSQTVSQTQAVRIDVKASKYEFSPGTIRVKAGTPLELHIVSTDVVHGFAIPALKINERLEPSKEVVVSFTPDQAGKYPFRCSVFCGSGHADMRGELIVE
jgi:heme/copper-type cytochrome/quinol oxidase subunit 2